ncbi:hypothetical protein GGR28_003485 [Lewinella aquimaris]|uniref:Uncharacterized protein n=1 Tax=Neolewinella aquimaris TaxID=1835722 RepID=A0A840EIY1_9BACT|nr:hypothetical protein [Neolewinella aquimaris]MBB4080846.1 hypothetical protein [Neolewinella aquimaris]
MKILKIISISVGLLVLLVIGLFWGSNSYYEGQDSKLYNIDFSEDEDYQKPTEYLSNKEIDSLKTIKVESAKIEIIGTGYSGYDFYMWHKPTEKGEIYIKAFEVTENRRLSEWKLTNRTRNIVTGPSEDFKLFTGNTVVDEGTFEKYYPARFELWFKSSDDETEKKLTEKSYFIDGWDR